MYYVVGVVVAVICMLIPPVAFILGAFIIAILAAFAVVFAASMVYYPIRQWYNPWVSCHYTGCSKMVTSAHGKYCSHACYIADRWQSFNGV